MTRSMPTRDDLIEKLQHLCSGDETRVAIANWATSIIDDDSLRVTERSIWGVLVRLGAVDLPASDREFLYSVSDFENWKSELLGLL